MLLVKSKVFWGLLAQLIAFISQAYFPQVPFTAELFLSIVGVVLAALGIVPELKARGLM